MLLKKSMGSSIAFLFVLTLSLNLASFDLYWGESGLLITRGWFLGGSHPPGYPFFLNLVHLIQRFPIGDIPSRANLLGSSFLAAAAYGLFVFFSRLKIDPLAGAASILLLCLSPVVMQSNAGVEVYTFNLLLTSIIIYQLFFYNFKRLLILSFICGIAVSHHLTFVLFLPALTSFVLIKEKNSRLKSLGLALLFFIFGFSAWLQLPVRETQTPLFVWGIPDNLSGFVKLVTASEESKGSFLAGIQSMDGIRFRFFKIVRLLNESFNWVGLPLIFLGCWRSWKINRKATEVLLLTIGCYSAIIAIYESNEIESFFLPILYVITIFLSFGLHDVFNFVRLKMPSFPSSIKYATMITFVFFLLMNATITAFNIRSHGTLLPRLLTRELLDRTTPDNVIILRQSDLSFLLWYHQYIEHRIPCNSIFQHLLSFKWYFKDLMKGSTLQIQASFSDNEFQDSWEWNRYVTANIVNWNSSRNNIWLTQPDIITDLRLAGLHRIAFYADYFCMRSQHSDQVERNFDFLIYSGRLDPLSTMVLSHQYHLRGEAMIINKNEKGRDRALRASATIYQYGVDQGWWNSLELN